MRATTGVGLLVRLERLERRVAEVSQHHCKLRIGNLKRLPPEYQGERHVVITKHLPNERDQERVEFEEVRGPDPNPPQRAKGVPPEYFDIHLVVPYSSEHNDGATPRNVMKHLLPVSL